MFAFCWLIVKLGLASLPSDLNFKHIYGCSLLCGVGFTMSLFIGGLAFQETGINQIFDERVGILAGSAVSAMLGFTVLYFVGKPVHLTEEELPTVEQSPDQAK